MTDDTLREWEALSAPSPSVPSASAKLDGAIVAHPQQSANTPIKRSEDSAISSNSGSLIPLTPQIAEEAYLAAFGESMPSVSQLQSFFSKSSKSAKTAITLHMNSTIAPKSQNPLEYIMQLLLRCAELQSQLNTAKARNEGLMKQVVTMDPNYNKLKERLKEKFREYTAEASAESIRLRTQHELQVSEFEQTISNLQSLNQSLTAQVEELKMINLELTARLESVETQLHETNLVLERTQSDLVVTQNKLDQVIALGAEAARKAVDAKLDTQCTQHIADMLSYIRCVLDEVFLDYRKSLPNAESRKKLNVQFPNQGSSVLNKLELDETDASFQALEPEEQQNERDTCVLARTLCKNAGLDESRLIPIHHAVRARNSEVHGADDFRKSSKDAAILKIRLSELQTELKSIDNHRHPKSAPVKEDVDHILITLLGRL